jgi:hypothetical protein
MGVPSITTCSPAAGPTGGQTYVEIAGTNFAMLPVPTVFPAVVPAARVGVSTVVTREATRVEVDATTHLSCLTPVGDHAENDASLVASIIVTNLDSSGVPITGETVTKTNAFTYSLPSLAVESEYVRILRALIQEFKRQVCEETVLTTETDWDDDTSDDAQETPEPTVPSLTLIGPRLSETDVRQSASAIKVQSGLTWKDYRPGRVKDCEFDIVLATGGEAAMTQGLNLCAQVVEFFERNPYLVLPLDPADLSKGNGYLELEMLAAPDADGLQNLDNLRSFRGSFVLKGVPFEGLPGIADDRLYRKGFAAETFETTTEQVELP